MADDLEPAPGPHLGEQADGEEAVRDGTAERALAPRPLDVDVDPLVVARELREAVDHVLRHLDRLAPRPELAGDLCLQGGDVIVADGLRHSPPPAVGSCFTGLSPTHQGLVQAWPPSSWVTRT